MEENAVANQYSYSVNIFLIIHSLKYITKYIITYLCEQMYATGGDKHMGFEHFLIHMTCKIESVVIHQQSS